MKAIPEHPIRTVAIVGGTHGNEFSGIYLERRYRAEPSLMQRSSFSCRTLLSIFCCLLLALQLR